MGLIVPTAPPATQGMNPTNLLLAGVYQITMDLICAVSDGPLSNTTNPILISTGSFTRAIFNVTGKDMTVFMDQWVRQGGHVQFQMSFIFNRKRLVSIALFTYCMRK